MKIIEEFYTLQMEGKYLGEPAYFIRFWGCNLGCNFCDSKFTWKYKPEQYDKIGLKDLSDKYKKYNHLVITGGEPLLYQKQILSLDLDNKFIEIETNGTKKILEEDLFDKISHFNISPKEQHYQEKSISVEPLLLEQINKMKNYSVKFVYNGQKTLDFMENIIEKYNIPKDKIIIMPQGVDREEVLKNSLDTIKICMFYGYRFSPREHINIWDTKKGV